MRIADHVSWERDVPVRYLLVQEDEDGVERFWGRCAGVEGLFVDPVPLPREVLTLRGCSPDGPLHDVLSTPGLSSRSLGDVLVEVRDGEQPVQWWTLVDAVVVTHRPHPADPARYDIVLGAGVRHEESFFELPARPDFELLAGTTAATESAGRCSAVEGLFRPRAAPAPVPMELIGCEPTEPLLAKLRRPQRRKGDWAHLLMLDRHGAVMASQTVGLAIAGARPSVLGGALVDVTLADGGDGRPSTVARPIWEQRYAGPPTEPNLWASYDSAGRVEWLHLALRGRREPASSPDRSGGERHLDGRFVTDVPGLHCAIAEALLGPGQYFGHGWDAFADCLCGGSGVVPPFTLVWHDSDVARRALAEVVDTASRLSYFEEIVQFLEQSGVTVVLR
ncbi:barstar family protein [Actinomadura hibisca]|uniref:barstar family protein n=1 Tax=Actinomadura hibisca TaxID=68565 RepID=UPI000A919D70|nr:barstar family protein [Actinomadura hibisca]